mgnify:CR=1 FL=1
MLQSFRIPRAALFNVLEGIHTQAAARTVPAEIKTAYIIMARLMAAEHREKEALYFTRKKNWRCREAAFQKHRS